MFLGLSNWNLTLWLDFFWLWWWNMNVDVFLHNSSTTASSWWVATESTAATTTWNCIIFLKIHSSCYQPNSMHIFGKFLINAVMHLDYLLPMYLWSFRSHGKHIEEDNVSENEEKKMVILQCLLMIQLIKIKLRVKKLFSLENYVIISGLKYLIVSYICKKCISTWRNCSENIVIKSFSAL